MNLRKKSPIVLNSFCPERALLFKLLVGYKEDFTKGRAEPEDAKWVLQYWLDIAFPTIPMPARRFILLCTGDGQKSDGLIPSLSATSTDASQATE